ncbi:MAG: guanylate kinase [Bacteroidia bacterium]|nr:guanylate kinase [Bacteroidia bacterium]
MSKGKVFIISAPSGAGKTTLVNRVLEGFSGFSFSVSATTRPARSYEQEGVHYYFITEADFRRRLSDGEFLEWQEVYEGRLYGTLKAEVERILAEGKNPIFDVDVEGGLNIKKHYGNNAVAIFISPPSLTALKERLRQRGSDNETEIARRLAKAEKEMAYRDRFDYVVVNDELEKATETLFAIVRAHI